MKRVPRHIIALTLFVCIASPIAALTQQDNAPYQQEFVITGYYSPEPGQCCYVLGGEYADKVMNGQGRAGADGTPVYPGMLAAPKVMPFGTRIEIPGIGIMTVHDRGGAIRALEDGSMRLDIWMGHGEEGLARAVAFGMRRFTGTVYPNGSVKPEENFDLSILPAPADRLQPFLTADWGLMSVRPELGEKGLSVRILQNHLRELGYLDQASRDHYDEATRDALKAFMNDMHLEGSGEKLEDNAALALLAAVSRKGAEIPLAYVNAESSEADLKKAQRILRGLGYYDGRTDGIYSDTLKQSILSFQQENNLVGTWEDPGAGQIGPITKQAMEHVWNREHVVSTAQKWNIMSHVRNTLLQRGELPEQFLQVGYTGNAVERLQQLLAIEGFFPEEEINGVFGPLTLQSVKNYQLARGIISSMGDRDAGYVGAQTIRNLRSDVLKRTYDRVRGDGMNVL